MREKNHELSITKIAMFLFVVSLASICLDWSVGVQIPQKIFTIPFLVFVPGFLLLMNLQMNISEKTNFLLFSFGISLILLVVLGFILNTVALTFGFKRPISKIPLLFSIYFISFVLFFILLYRNRFSDTINQMKIQFSEKYLPLLFILFGSVFSSYLLNSHKIGVFIFLLYLVIAIIPLLGCLDFIPRNLYPFTIFITAVSFLLTITLTHIFLHGADIAVEHYFAETVKNNSYWSPTLGTKYNSLLVNVMGFSILSKVSKLSLTSLYKVILPFYIALVPVGVYQVFKTIGRKKTFLSVLFLVFFFGFFKIIIVKQRIAGFFLILFILLLFEERKIEMKKKSILGVLLVFALVFSHYGVGFLALYLFTSFSLYKTFFEELTGFKLKRNVVKPSFLCFFALILFTWYIYSCSAASFKSLVFVLYSGVKSVVHLFRPAQLSTIGYMTKSVPLVWKITKGLQIALLGFISIAILHSATQLLNKRKRIPFSRLNVEKVFLALSAWFLIAVSVLAPRFFGKGGMHSLRLYLFTLIFLSPYSVIGIEKISGWLKKFLGIKLNPIKVGAVFCVVFFLFNSSFMAEVQTRVFSNDSYSINESLLKNRIENSTGLEKINYYGSTQPPQTVQGAEWLGKSRDNQLKILVNRQSRLELVAYGRLKPKPREKKEYIPLTAQKNFEKIDRGFYLFLSETVLTDNIIVTQIRKWKNSSFLLKFANKQAKVYSNGNAIVFKGIEDSKTVDRLVKALKNHFQEPVSRK